MIGRTVAIQGTMQRSGEEASLKQAQDNKSSVNQMNAQVAAEKNELHKAIDVVSKENADYNQQKYDAKEKGKNEYLGTMVKKKKKKDEEDGKVIVKGNSGNFDLKI